MVSETTDCKIRLTAIVMSKIQIITCKSPADYQKAIQITLDYMDWLNIDLGFQNTEKEFQTFPEMYGEPNGLFLLAEVDETLAGGVGFRQLEDGICEMKRLYVYEKYQKLGLGKKLCEVLIQTAAERGYKKMRLDTLKSMQSAVALYQRLGFYEIPAYCFNPETGAIYMELELRGHNT